MRVFVTRETFTADLGGLAGADALCQAAAKDAGLSGSFRAWLSSAPASADAFARLTGDGPWYTVGGVTAFGDRPDRFGPPMTDLADETGHLPTQPDGGSWSVWSGSDANGRRDGLDCAGWTSASSTERGAVGNAQADDVEWGGGHVNVACSTRASLVCFQQ